MGKLKIGILINEKKLDQITFNILKIIKAKNDIFYDPVLIFEEDKKRYHRGSFFKKNRSKLSLSFSRTLIRRLLYLFFIRLVELIEFSVVKKSFKDFDKSYFLTDEDYKKIKVSRIWVKSKKIFSNSSYEDIEKLKKENFDVLLRLGNGILDKAIFKVTKFGILSFNYGNYRIKREDPFGLLEALNKEHAISFTIIRINEESIFSDVIFKGSITAHKLWLMNIAQISKKSSIFMVKVLEKIYLNQKLEVLNPLSRIDGEIFALNNRYELIFKYILKILIPYILNNLKGRVFGFPLSCWSIAYSKTSLGYKSLKSFKEIKNPIGRFFADPFIMQERNRKIIFVEDFFFKDNKGRISAIDVSNDNEEFLGIVLEEDFHLSFPFVFKENNNLYMVPECSNSNQIRLYECTEFPMKWKFKCILMDSVSAVDTLLIKKEDFWFMLTNICTANICNHSSELHIFYSDKLFSNNWTPIKQTNPVIFDSRQARNGGIFFEEGNIYRVNQVQTPDTYGYSLKINLVKKLDKFIYEEQTIDEIKPFFKEDLSGTHHFNSYEDISVIDFYRKRSYKEIFRNNK